MGMEVFRRETRNSGFFDNYFRNNIEVYIQLKKKRKELIYLYVKESRE